MDHFEGYFLGARAVLDIFFEFAPVMESGRKNEGAILHLLMQFNASGRCIFHSINLKFFEKARSLFVTKFGFSR